MSKFRGTTIFEGISIGKPYLKKRKEIVVKEFIISENEIDKELERVEEALKETRIEITELIESLKDRVNKSDLKKYID
mgnify:FL=1